MQIDQSQFSLPGGRIPSGGIEGRREGEGFGSGGEGRVPSPDLKPKSASHSPGVEPQNSPSPIPVPELRGRKGQAWGVWAQGVHRDPKAQERPAGSGVLGRSCGLEGWKGRGRATRQEEAGAREGPPWTFSSALGARPAGSEDIRGITDSQPHISPEEPHAGANQCLVS